MSKSIITEDVKNIFEELTGEDLSSVDLSTNLFDLGIDSLTLTQVSGELKKRFAVQVTFRDLVENYSSISEISEYISSQLPDETEEVIPDQPAKPETTAIPTKVPVTGITQPSSSSSNYSEPDPQLSPKFDQMQCTGSTMEKIMAYQLKIMELQISMLSDKVPHPRSTSTSETPVQTDKVATTPVAPVAKTTEKEEQTVQHGPFRPLVKKEKKGLSDNQKEHIAWLTDRYVKRTQKSKEYTQRYREHFADPRAVSGFNQLWKELVYPIVATKSSGAHLWDLDGNRWLDVTLGFGVNLLGHSPPFITEVLKNQLDEGVEIGPQNALAGEVAELISDFTGMDRVAYCNTGSEAVMAAMRLCRTVTGRTRIVFFASDYHGTFDEVLARGVWPGGQPKTLPLAPGVAPNLISEITILKYGTDESLEWIRQHATDLAAVLVEPVQSRNPGLQPREFLHELRVITENAETPLIFDEVITGFRCHPGGAQAYFGVRADLTTYGKVIGGGMPIGIVAGRKEYMDALDGGFWQYGDDSFPPSGVTFFAGTFIRHPLAMASAKAMLLHLQNEGPQLQSDLADRTSRMLADLNSYFNDNQIPVELNNFTSVWYPRFGDNVKYSSLLYYHLREKGLHIWEGRPCFLSTVHTAENEEFIKEAFKSSVQEMYEGGFLPKLSQPSTEATSLVFTNDSDQIQKDTIQSRLTESEIERFPLSEAQHEMWVGAQMHPEAAGPHHACTGVYLEGDLDIEVLRKSISTVVKRHPGLRCTFSEDGTEAILHSSMMPDIPLHDLSNFPEAQQQERVDALLLEESQRIFDLAKGPLFDFKILQLSERKHLLIFTVNMIVCDGWSHYVVFEDLGSLYSALIKGQEPSLKAPVPPWEYVKWERDNSASERTRESEAFWISTYNNVPAPINLPTADTRPPTRTFRADREEIILDEDLCHKIKNLGRARKNSYFTILLAAFGGWLHKLSGSQDIVVGVPFAAQSPLHMDRLVGQCANILPLKIECNPDQPFADVLKNTWSTVLDAQDHWDFSFARLLAKMDLPNDPSRIPLVSVLFNLDPPMSQVKFEGLDHQMVAGPRYYFQYDIGFNLVEDDRSIRVECDYNQKLFKGDIVRQWLAGYMKILEKIVQQPESPMKHLTLTGKDISPPNNASDAQVKDMEEFDQTLDALVDSQIKKNPGATAVTTVKGSLTFQELDKLSLRIGDHLIAHGYEEGAIIGIYDLRPMYLPAALLAVAKLGGVYVFIDASSTNDEIAQFTDDCGVAILLMDTLTQSKVDGSSAQVSDLNEAITSSDSSQVSDLRPSSIDSDSVATLICHKDTHGKKRVEQITHRTLTACLLSLQSKPGVSENDVFLYHHTNIPGFEFLELWLPLSAGATCHISDKSIVEDAKAVSQIIGQQDITTVMATPSTWRLLLATGWKGKSNLKALCWGEALRSEFVSQLEKKCEEVWNLYGRIEMALVSTVGQVSSEQDISIGTPVVKTKVIIVDESMERAPLGVPGEVLLSGPQLLSNYIPIPAKDQSIDIDFGDNDTVRFSKTGDLARYLTEESIEFCGRINTLCTVNGCSFHPWEVESVLLQHSAVKDTAVSFKDDGGSFFGLVAYITLEQIEEKQISFGLAEQIRELGRLLRQKLPGYMVPDRFVVVDNLPRRPDGRVDLDDLPAPGEDSFSIDEYVAPRDENEKILSEIWCDLLNLERVSIKDSFFDLGGQSLLAVRMFTRIEKEIGRRFPIAMLFRAPTIEQLARKLSENAATSSNWPSLVPIQPHGDKKPLFLVHGAGGNVLLYRPLAKYLGPENPLYGLQSQGLDGESEPLKTIEEMADFYLQEILLTQPKGPYYLGGYCLGGTIAYEMAQRLTARGEQVNMVAMLDTYNFIRALKSSFFTFLLQKIRFHLGNFRRLDPGTLWKYLLEKRRVAGDGGWAHIKTERPGTTLQDGVARAESGIEASVQELNDRAADIYDPKPYPGTLTLFKPQINYKFYPDPKMGWGDMALGGLDIIEMPINPHAMLLEPYVKTLAQELKIRMP